MRRLLKIQNDRHTTDLRHHLLKHLQHLPAHRELAQRESGDIAAGSSQACDVAAADWIVDLVKTIGMLWVARFSDSNGRPPLVQITSGFMPTSSAA